LRKGLEAMGTRNLTHWAEQS